MVRQWQEFQYGGRYLETPISSPDPLKLAAVCRLPGYRVRHLDEIIPAPPALCRDGAIIPQRVIVAGKIVAHLGNREEIKLIRKGFKK